MNILPKKRWHVRTKENIARVRRDEENARKEEAERIKRIELADKEARSDVLRTAARTKYDGRPDEDSNSKPTKHINFFQDCEDVVQTTNKDYEAEKKETSEKYEKQIGYLTYLGQDTVESTGNISWFNKVPDRFSKTDNAEVDVVKKVRHDPLEKMNFHLQNRSSVPKVELSSKLTLPNSDQKHTSSKKKRTKSKKSKSLNNTARNKKKKSKRKLCSSDNSESEPSQKRKKRSHEDCNRNGVKHKRSSLDELRAKRLKRENNEKHRAASLLAQLRGSPIPKIEAQIVQKQQKYNSQFNPHIARQNQES